MHVRMAQTWEEKIIDFNGRAGSKVTPSMWKDLVLAQARDGFGYHLKGKVNALGYTSIAVPSTVMGLYEVLTRYGTIPWKELIRPAINLAGRGYMIRSTFAPTLVTAEAKRVYTKNGAPYEAGEVIVNKDYAETLRLIASGGADTFYKGEIAARIVDDMEQNGGFITQRDLYDCKVKVYPPLTTDYRGYTVASNDAPGGGITLLELLNILECYDLARYDWRGMGSDIADYIEILVVAMRAAERDRSDYVGDPDFVSVPTKMLIAKDRAEEWIRRAQSGERIIIPRWVPQEPPSTTHLSVVDAKGNAVSLTHTLGSCSGVITPGLGFLYNNAMINFDPVPSKPNSMAPGKGRLTQMAPTIVLKNGLPYIVLGAPGGGRILSSLLQTICNIIDHGMTPFEAVAHPRVFSLHTDIVDVCARMPSYICDELEAKGNIVVKTTLSHGAFAYPQALVIDREKNRVLGGSDPASGGVALST